MATKLPFESYVEQLGVALLDRKDVKAVMMAKDEFGNVAVTLVEGIEILTKSGSGWSSAVPAC